MGSSVSIARIFAQKSQLNNLLRPNHLVHLVEGFAANRSDWLERDSMAMGIILSGMGLSSDTRISLCTCCLCSHYADPNS